ncbi:hypothetical protein [Gloeocapsa sp. PCC 73106]|uniref:hypothetical protein n=1 Tax=Gloeocapsa sp. PCC 73106 TaxID=102232 RepID=UPI0002ACEA0A|nr:hypothetical protein [Gloeocapsa sp. PCC 73106]ELR99440.1 hypothetical protein GLO73106DRAFT_00032910 [Gloeocapsa sp. PCC 73106]
MIKAWINLLAILAAFGMNVVSNLMPLNDLNAGEISNQYFQDVLIIPANYAFAIWGLIYLGLISFGIYQVRLAQSNRTQDKGGYLITIASIAQIIWLFLFQLRLFSLSVVLMVGILIPLILLYLRLGVAIQSASQTYRWLVYKPLSLYLAWISVATIVNVAIAIYDSGWNSSPVTWTIIMLIVSAILGGIIAYRRSDRIFGGVLIWAWIAIAVRQLEDNWLIAGTALSLSLILALWLIFRPNYRQ